MRIFSYLEDKEWVLESATDKFMLSVAAFGAELEREKARQRTYDAMQRKASRGHVAGGKLYGYRNAAVVTAGIDGPRRDHVRREIVPEEAAVIRRIFEMAAAGKGLLRIAKTLNAEGIRSPERQRRKDRTLRRAGWAPSAVREMLHRDLYRGLIVWGKTRRIDRGGTKATQNRPESEWTRLEAPELRIVPEDLWCAAHERLQRTRVAYLRYAGGRAFGRPETGVDSPYLLTGLSVCGVCGGSLFVRKRPDGRNHARAPYAYYACTTHHLRGPRICANGLGMTMSAADAAVLDVLEADILDPRVITLAIETTVHGYSSRPSDIADQRADLEPRLRRLEAEIANLTDAVRLGGNLATLVAALQDAEQRRADLRARSEHLDGLARALPRLDPRVLAEHLEKLLLNWQGLLRAEPAKARQMLRKLLNGRLIFDPHNSPEAPYYQFKGEASYGRLLAGVVVQKGWWPRARAKATTP